MSTPAPTAAAIRDEEPPPAPRRDLAGRAAFLIGSAGLLMAMASDSIAVLGRHTGFALIGAIEIVQSAIVLIAATSLVSVTLSGGHAAVHILTDRLPPARRKALARASYAVSAVAVVLLAVGSAIILVDVWDGHERSELLHIPLRWFRLLMIAALTFVALVFARSAIAPGAPDGD